MQRLGKSLATLWASAAHRVCSPAAGCLLEQNGAALGGLRFSSAAATASSNPLTALQDTKRALRPQNSGRNAFRRGWAKNLQIKWDAQRRAAQQAAARQRRHEERLQRFAERKAMSVENAEFQRMQAA